MNKGLRLTSYLLAVAMTSALMSCSDLVRTQLGRTEEPKPDWHDPMPVDLGAADEDLLAYTSGGRSFKGFQLTGTDTQAAMLGGFYNGSKIRAVGRVYYPRAEDGEGWSENSSIWTYLDTGETSITDSRISFSPEGDILAFFTDGTAALSQSAWFDSTSKSWTNSQTAITTATLNTSPPSIGDGSSLAWDADGDAWLGTVGPSGIYAHHYDPSDFWDTSTSGTHLGFNGTQVEALGDGAGVAFLWGTSFDPNESNQISVGAQHSCMLSNGKLKCWGFNYFGELGDGTSGEGSNASSPVEVEGLDQSYVSQVAAGSYFTCALLVDETVKCWGRNHVGQLGDGTTTNSTSPVTVSGLAGVSSIAAGGLHACAVISGAVKCWGYNGSGQLGNNSTTDSKTPVSVSSLSTVEEISLGYIHSCARLTSGGVKCWGENGDGQLGDDSTTDSSTPVTAKYGTSSIADVVQVEAGSYHSCAIQDSGDLVCWGDNAYGQVGDGITPLTDQDVGVLVTGVASVADVSAGDRHTCALGATGTLKCWGYNDYGQLGNGESMNVESGDADSSTAVDVVGLASVEAVSIGYRHSCATTSTGAAYCWGRNTNNELGDGVSGASTLSEGPVEVTGAIPCASGECIHATWRVDGAFSEPMTISSGAVSAIGFAAASDEYSNVVAAFIQHSSVLDDDECSTQTTPDTSTCKNRIFASVRNAQDDWTSPQPLDTELNEETSSYYQPSSTVGGVDYCTPAVANLGDGNFLVVFALTKLDDALSGIYSRRYSTGGKWDAAMTTVVEVTLEGIEANGGEDDDTDDGTDESDTPLQYRYANELHLSSDGAGNALLVAQVLVDDDAEISNRRYGFKVFRYNIDDGWSEIKEIAGDYQCPVLTCAMPKVAGHVFPDGETVILFPAPKEADSTDLRLYSIEYY